MQIEPYLFFEGRCEEALEFYRQALGAEVTYLMRYGESPEGELDDPSLKDKIMHANVRAEGASFMVSDGDCQNPPSFRGFSLCLSLEDEAKVRTMFAALAEQGQVRMPLGQTFFSPLFGMVEDRFGVVWMLLVTP